MGGASERSFGTVIRDIGGNVDRIVRAELRMAIAELRDGVDAASSASRFLIAGIALATLAMAFVLLSVMLGLARVMPMWLAAFAVSAGAGVAGALLLVEGRSRIASRLAPPSTDLVSPPETVA